MKVTPPVFLEGKYTSRGKWMDGWETRRRRTPGYDWCLVRFGFQGLIRELVIDTRYFKSNCPEQCMVEACLLQTPSDIRSEHRLLKSNKTKWIVLLPMNRVTGDTPNYFKIQATSPPYSHLRLRIYPDGGVARFRVNGEAAPNEELLSPSEVLNLAAMRLGASVVSSSDESFGSASNLLIPKRPRNMGEGWETRRRHGLGHEWAVVKLGIPGNIERIEIDSAYFKDNYPESCSVEGAEVQSGVSTLEGLAWKEIHPRVRLKPNARHILRDQLRKAGLISHVRFNIFPDGGVSRLRIFGFPGPDFLIAGGRGLRSTGL